MQTSLEASKLLSLVSRDRQRYTSLDDEGRRSFDHSSLYQAIEFLLNTTTDAVDQRTGFLKGNR